jgi:chorismate mutase
MDAATQEELLALQTEVKEIDQQIMLLLGVRFRCTDQISAMARARQSRLTPKKRGIYSRFGPIRISVFKAV